MQTVIISMTNEQIAKKNILLKNLEIKNTSSNIVVRKVLLSTARVQHLDTFPKFLI
jgi:hypothetical protein